MPFLRKKLLLPYHFWSTARTLRRRLETFRSLAVREKQGAEVKIASKLNHIEFLPRSVKKTLAFSLHSLVETCIFAHLALILVYKVDFK